MRDAEILEALKNERDHAIFAQRAEAFVKRWAPDDPQERWEFTAGLMGLFRDMILTTGHVHQMVAARYFEQQMGATAAINNSLAVMTGKLKKDDPNAKG